MDVGSIAQLSTTMAETGIRQDVGVAVLKKAQEIQSSTATALIDALPPRAGRAEPAFAPGQPHQYHRLILPGG